jgi:hypothetical protein
MLTSLVIDESGELVAILTASVSENQRIRVALSLVRPDSFDCGEAGNFSIETESRYLSKSDDLLLVKLLFAGFPNRHWLNTILRKLLILSHNRTFRGIRESILPSLVRQCCR